MADEDVILGTLMIAHLSGCGSQNSGIITTNAWLCWLRQRALARACKDEERTDQQLIKSSTPNRLKTWKK